MEKYAPAAAPSTMAIALYDNVDPGDHRELGFRAGNVLLVVKEEAGVAGLGGVNTLKVAREMTSSAGWCVCRFNEREGLVPKNYVAFQRPGYINDMKAVVAGAATRSSVSSSGSGGSPAPVLTPGTTVPPGYLKMVTPSTAVPGQTAAGAPAHSYVNLPQGIQTGYVNLEAMLHATEQAAKGDNAGPGAMSPDDCAALSQQPIDATGLPTLTKPMRDNLSAYQSQIFALEQQASDPTASAAACVIAVSNARAQVAAFLRFMNGYLSKSQPAAELLVLSLRFHLSLVCTHLAAINAVTPHNIAGLQSKAVTALVALAEQSRLIVGRLQAATTPPPPQWERFLPVTAGGSAPPAGAPVADVAFVSVSGSVFLVRDRLPRAYVIVFAGKTDRRPLYEVPPPASWEGAPSTGAAPQLVAPKAGASFGVAHDGYAHITQLASRAAALTQNLATAPGAQKTAQPALSAAGSASAAPTGDPAVDINNRLADVLNAAPRLAALLKKDNMQDVNVAVRAIVTDIFRFLDVIQPLRKAGVASKDMHVLADGLDASSSELVAVTKALIADSSAKNRANVAKVHGNITKNAAVLAKAASKLLVKKK